MLHLLTLGLAVLLAAPISTPAERGVATYVNAEIASVDRAGHTVVVKGRNGEQTLVLDPTLGDLSDVHTGDNVILTVHPGPDAEHQTAVVTEIRPTSVGKAGATVRVIGPVRVSAVDRQKQLVSLIEEDGKTRVYPVRERGLSALGTLGSGDSVWVTVSSAPPNPEGVVRIDTATAPLNGAPSVSVAQAAPPPATAVVPPATVGGVPLFVAPPIPSAPSPAPTGNVVLPADGLPGTDSVARGTRDLQAAALVLAAKANQIDQGWIGFREQCLPATQQPTNYARGWFQSLDGTIHPDSDGCRRQLGEVQSAAAAFRNQLTIAVDAAARAGVVPGRIREILQHETIDIP